MIELRRLQEILTNRLQEIADNQNSDLQFAIQTDTGAYIHPLRDGNVVEDYVNGVIKLITSENSTLPNGITISTPSARLDLIVRLPDITADERYNNQELETVTKKVEKVRKVLDELTTVNTTELVDDEYTVSTIYQNAIMGERAIFPNIGDGVVFSINAFWIIVEGGLNARSIMFNLDGAMIPYTTFTINHAKTFDSNVPANTTTGRIENTAIQSNWSVTFEVPAIVGDFLNVALGFATGNEPLNCVHCLAITNERLNTIKSYLVTIAEDNFNGETVKNTLNRITFFEARKNYYLLSFPTGYIRYRATETPNTVSFENGGFYVSSSDVVPHYVSKGSSASNIATGTLILTSAPLFDTTNFEEVT